MMKINPLQWRHTECTAKLIQFMILCGDKPRLAYAKRSKIEAINLGFPDSNHTRYLAVDIDLFDKDGNYQEDTESHRKYGEYWKSLDPQAVWGGDFAKPDGNHYSFIYKGIK